MNKLTEFVGSSLSHVLNRLIDIISWRHLFTCCPAILIDRWGLYHLSFFNPFVVKLCPCFHEVLMLQNILFSFEKYNPKEKKREKQETKKENKTQDLLIPPPKKNPITFFSFSDVRRYTVRYKPNLYRWPH